MISLLGTVWERDYGDPSRKLVMLCLADMANNAGVCWPSIQTIANRCSLSRRSVHRHMAILSKAGHIAISHKFRDGQKAANHYKIITKGSVTHDTGVVSPASHRITNRTSETLKDPRSLLTRPTQLPPSLRKVRQ